MPTIHLVTLLKAGVHVFEFAVAGDAGHSEYIAGNAIDRLSDYHGGNDWDYEVREVPFVADGENGSDAVRLALSKVVI
ncbi:hypothetical protein [uncultured Alsobacter sp.]|uniref:hypothetical protein n=1 Tax=uncultured Alsobacter sp. TaxID=1748258 RepID=UPI0025D230B0|nr:hypothetical protein [uncultured Alsobacter sp.]